MHNLPESQPFAEISFWISIVGVLLTFIASLLVSYFWLIINSIKRNLEKTFKIIKDEHDKCEIHHRDNEKLIFRICDDLAQRIARIEGKLEKKR